MGWSSHAPYPYTAEVTSQGPSGTQARLTDPNSNAELLLTGRGILLYVLATKLIEDRAANMSPASEGWCNDSDVLRAIWAEMRRIPIRCVLVYRLRKAAEKAGFESWFIEKRQWVFGYDWQTPSLSKVSVAAQPVRQASMFLLFAACARARFSPRLGP